ncbi:hypothetical protein [Breznakia pachnodae]|uniref:Cardiolipin synthase N-terminal domain-containing protein n=1 Tax=Breznakia pachnodae TaxID=265178 RepID=A0ABU0E414_9FIRM|nr:hypothetical protein [Breznakia pachnodae]MDQ0361632.1 hypothetical protein [Breznakia pachnodae]
MEQILNIIIGIIFIWIPFGGLTVGLYFLVFSKNAQEKSLLSVFALWFLFLIPIVIIGIWKLVKNTLKSSKSTFKQIFNRGESKK